MAKSIKSSDCELEDEDENPKHVTHIIEGNSEFPAGTCIAIQESRGVHFGNKTYIQSDRVIIHNVNNNRPQDNEGTENEIGLVQTKTTLKRNILGPVISGVFLLITILSLLVYFLAIHDSDSFRMISSKEWLAGEPGMDSILETPVPYVIILHTATEQCTNQVSCARSLRYFKALHEKNLRWSDIAYNFLIGGDGVVYEGRSWDTIGAHTMGYNSKSIGIALIGTFEKVIPPKRQLKALKELIKLGVKLNKIDVEYKLFGARQLGRSMSPGEALFNVIKTWDHFAETT